MATKRIVMALNIATTLIALGSMGSAMAHDCTKCVSKTPSVTVHEPLYGEFHEQITPTDAQGRAVGCLDISGKSVKVGADWTYSTGDGYAWETHTTKYNSATVVEERTGQ
jgi:hypothetical protein